MRATQDEGSNHVARSVAAALAAGRSAGVVGTPGSGLTRTLVEAHGRLHDEHGLAPDDVLVLTPNRAHADALRNRLTAGAQAVRTGGAGARSVQSYAFGIVAADSAVRLGEPMRFLSGADQDAVLASLLTGYAEGRSPDPGWPQSFTREMTGTVSFRDQLRDALDRILERGIEPTDIDAAAQRRDRTEWAALARIVQDYRDVTRAFSGYGGIDTSSVLATTAAILAEERAEGTTAGGIWSFSGESVPRCVLLDAAQDVPDAVNDLLQGLRALGCGVAVFGSPDSSTQGFRGAGGGLLSSWASTVRAEHGGDGFFALPARAGGARGAGAIRDLCVSLSRRISAHLPLGHVPPPGQSDDHDGDSAVRVLEHRSAAERTRHAASIIRAWHHDDGVPFSDIAVVARTGGTAVALRAELGALGLPVESTDLPLSADPATLPLLELLTADLDDPAARSALLGRLLGGVYGNVDALALRGLQRQAVRALVGDEDQPADDPLLSWIDAADDDALPPPLARAAKLLELGVALRGAGPHEALWALWEATGVAEVWRGAVLNDPRSPLRERLDAVVRLFALATKTEDTVGLGASAFAVRVLDQVYAQDSIGRRDSLDLLTVDSPAGTAHRSYARVIVVDVDEGGWPNPRIRRNAFHPEDLIDELADTDAASVVDAPGEDMRRRRMKTIRDEASLFLSAASRARDELVVCALDDGETSPSALHHLCREFATDAATGAADEEASPGPHLDGRPADWRNSDLPPRLRDVVGLARQQMLLADEPEEWARLVAALAEAGLREADPQTWSTWFSVSSDAPAHSPDEPVRIRPSQVERFATCPLQWFLVECGGRTMDTTAAALGTVIHGIAEHHAEPDRAAMLQEYEETFDEEQIRSEWEREQQREDVEAMIDILCDYLALSRDELAALTAAGKSTAVLREVAVTASGADDAVGAPWTVTGRIDRLEVLGDSVRIVDFKTGKTVPTAKEILDDPQLLVYQYAVSEGALLVDGAVDVDASSLPSAGAQIVKLKGSASRVKGVPRYLREQPAMETGDEAHETAGELIGRAAEGMRRPAFTAVTGPHCTYCPVRTSCPAIATTTPEVIDQ
ncbi:UrvD/REP family ATP-dependent DNA helicase [Brevibacterium jeotgali]|uniref:DNA 3'-5' helicase n=1 Tax=Brevibacterium jeotgali TaxID=1262550 RepID=A0A2H1L7Q5_9MICO|nr:UrvD/REP family ATP-dependent DNA helicase [Brevibacterium jeotgali]TWC03279.1 superfamily I DNA/RNA helicase [Brevibacterium jeotgali]SMY12938.1 Superfamily I DNA or RNA helicase [Brevibacterium jeotgali]